MRDENELSEEALLEAAEYATAVEVRKGDRRKGGPIEDPEDYTLGVLRHLRSDHERARQLLARKERRAEIQARRQASARAMELPPSDPAIDSAFPRGLRPTVLLRMSQASEPGWSEHYAASLRERRPLDLATWIGERHPALWSRVAAFIDDHGEAPIVELEAAVCARLRRGMARFFARWGEDGWGNEAVLDELRRQFVAGLRSLLVAAPELVGAA